MNLTEFKIIHIQVYYKITPTKRLCSPSLLSSPIRRRRQYQSLSHSPCRGRSINGLSGDPTSLACHSPQRSAQQSLHCLPLLDGNIFSASIRQSANVEHDQTNVAAPIHLDTSDIDGMPGSPKRLSITSGQHQTDLSSQRHKHRHRPSTQHARVTLDLSLPEYTLNRNVSTIFDLWREWTVGIGTAGPAISKLNKDFGSRWQTGWKGKDRQFYSQ